MTRRTILRRLIRDLRALRRALASDRGPVLRDDPPVSLETLWARPAVEPDRTGYVTPSVDGYQDAACWLYGDQTRGWWETEPNETLLAATLLLEWRDRLDECPCYACWHGWTAGVSDRD